MRKIYLLKIRFTMALILSLCAVSDGFAQSTGDLNWLLRGDAHDTIFDQAGRSPACAAMAAGTLVANWFTNGAAGIVLNGTQQDWAWRAVAFSKMPDPNSQQTAVALVAAGQCHNSAAMNWIINNPGPVLDYLRSQ